MSDRLNVWVEEIKGLVGEDLYSKAVAANSHSFARSLIESGWSMAEVEQILTLFVRQLKATGVKIPGGGAFDLNLMALTDPEARKGVKYTPEEVGFLGTLGQKVPDTIDLFLSKAAFMPPEGHS